MSSQASKSAEPCIAAVRIRGLPAVPHPTEIALRSMGLVRRNQATLLSLNPVTKGMLDRTKDMITWGEINADVLADLLKKKATTREGRQITEEFVKQKFDLESIDDLAKSIQATKIRVEKLWSSGVRPVLRLHPPKGGFRLSTKRPYKDLGELGYRGPAINDLVKSML